MDGVMRKSLPVVGDTSVWVEEGCVAAIWFGDAVPTPLADEVPLQRRARWGGHPVCGLLEDCTRGVPVEMDVPLRMRGTAFQRQVWSVVRGIPYGVTVSYREVAALVGRPGAARAVACALRANVLPLVIPCHRVVYADGRPGGFSWGVSMKLRLLHMEARSVSASDGSGSLHFGWARE